MRRQVMLITNNLFSYLAIVFLMLYFVPKIYSKSLITFIIHKTAIRATTKLPKTTSSTTTPKSEAATTEPTTTAPTTSTQAPTTTLSGTISLFNVKLDKNINW